MQVINQGGLYVDKIEIEKKISGYGLYTGALNRPKITVVSHLVLMSQRLEPIRDCPVQSLVLCALSWS